MNSPAITSKSTTWTGPDGYIAIFHRVLATVRDADLAAGIAAQLHGWCNANLHGTALSPDEQERLLRCFTDPSRDYVLQTRSPETATPKRRTTESLWVDPSEIQNVDPEPRTGHSPLATCVDLPAPIPATIAPPAIQAISPPRSVTAVLLESGRDAAALGGFFLASAIVHAAAFVMLALVFHLFTLRAPIPPAPVIRVTLSTRPTIVPPIIPPKAEDDSPDEPILDDSIADLAPPEEIPPEAFNAAPAGLDDLAKAEFADAPDANIADLPPDLDLDVLGIGTDGPIGDSGDGGIPWSDIGGLDRDERILQNGGTPATIAARDAALDWLARHQNPDTGLWNWYGYLSRCPEDRPCHLVNKEYAKYAAHNDSEYDIANTAIALLAFLTAGNSPTEGPYRETVEAGVSALLSKQKRGIFSANMYTHAMATAAILETIAAVENTRLSSYVPGESGPPALIASARDALAVIYASQHSDGGWRYEVIAASASVENRKGQRPDTRPATLNSASDLSVTGWVAVPLKIAQDVMPSSRRDLAFVELRAFVRSCESPKDYHEAGYMAGQGMQRNTTPRMTAVAMVCNLLLGETEDRQRAVMQGSVVLGSFATQLHSSPVCEKTRRKLLVAMNTLRRREAEAAGLTGDSKKRCLDEIDALVREIESARGETRQAMSVIDSYMLYYGQIGMYGLGQDRWQCWNELYESAVLPFQSLTGCERGSWPMDGSGHFHSPCFVTAMHALMLQVYYRFDDLREE